MASVTYQVQGSYAIFPSRPVSLNKGVFPSTLHIAVKTNKFPKITCKSCLSVRPPVVRVQNAKSFRITAFKGNAKNDEPGGKAIGSNSAKNFAKLSYVQQESENNFSKSPEMQDVQISYEPDGEKISGSLAIQNIFKNWLTLLRTAPPPPSPPNEAADEIIERSYSEKVAEIQDVVPKEKGDNIGTAIWEFFWGLNASIKVPLLLFTPLFLAVTVIHGAEVSKELTPLWIFGPLIIALYVKIIKLISALYAFTFKQTVTVVKKSPAFSVMVYKYIFCGRLKEDIYAHTWQKVLDMKNKDYKEFSIRKMKEFKEWAGEKYLDYVESIWPTYCKIIRFLKRANLI